MNEIIFQAVNLVVMIATLVVVRYIVPWIKDKIGAEALNTLCSMRSRS